MGAAVFGVHRQKLAPGVSRPGCILDAIGEEDAQLLQHGHLLRRIGKQASLRLTDVGQHVPHLLALVQLLQLGQCFTVLWIGLAHPLPQLNRDGRLLQLLRGQLGDLDKALSTLGRIGNARHFPLIDRDQLLPVTALLVVALEVCDRFAIAVIQRQRLLVGFDRFGDVAEALLEQTRYAAVDRNPLGYIFERARLLLQRRDQVRPALHSFVLRGHRIQRPNVAGLDRQDRVEGIYDLGVDAQPIFVKLDQLE